MELESSTVFWKQSSDYVWALRFQDPGLNTELLNGPEWLIYVSNVYFYHAEQFEFSEDVILSQFQSAIDLPAGWGCVNQPPLWGWALPKAAIRLTFLPTPQTSSTVGACVCLLPPPLSFCRPHQSWLVHGSCPAHHTLVICPHRCQCIFLPLFLFLSDRLLNRKNMQTCVTLWKKKKVCLSASI